MVANFSAGGAAINQICNAYGLGLKVFELALDQPTPDIVVEDAFDEKSCAATIAYGMEAVAGGIDLLCLGEMGIANTTVAAAIFHALYGGERGGLGRPRHRRRRCGAEAEGGRGRAQRWRGSASAAIRSKCCAGSAGARSPRWSARSSRRGWSACRSSSTASSRPPPRRCSMPSKRDAIDHCLFAHRSAEAAHGAVLDRLGKTPLLDLGMRLGEGTGAALAAGIVKAALAAHNGMATFERGGRGGEGRLKRTFSRDCAVARDARVAASAADLRSADRPRSSPPCRPRRRGRSCSRARSSASAAMPEFLQAALAQ